ncbi:MAG TPA: hypothetical protein VF248_06005 [Nitrososphaeraceae archaeon]
MEAVKCTRPSVTFCILKYPKLKIPPSTRRIVGSKVGSNLGSELPGIP